MADVSFTAFPAGATVDLYPHGQCDPYKTQGQAPPFAATDSDTVGTDSVVSFTGLTAGLYYAVATVDNRVQYVTGEATE